MCVGDGPRPTPHRLPCGDGATKGAAVLLGRARRRTASLVEPGQRRGQPQGLPRALGLELVPALRRNQPPCSLLGRPEVASNPLWKQRGGSRRGSLVPSDVTPGHLVFHSSNGFLVSVPPGCCRASRLPVPGNQRSADSMHPAIAESVGSPLSSLITSSRRKSARYSMLCVGTPRIYSRSVFARSKVSRVDFPYPRP